MAQLEEPKGATSMPIASLSLIARREYLERIRTRGFIITTVMIPLIMAGFIFGSIFLGSKASFVTEIAVVSSDTQLALDLQSELLQQEQGGSLTQPSLPTQGSPHHRRRHGRRSRHQGHSRPGD
jgi:hypothetical protein